MRTEKASYGVMPTPTYDDFETVTISIHSRPGTGFRFEDDITVEQAFELSTELLRWANVVRDERDAQPS